MSTIALIVRLRRRVGGDAADGGFAGSAEALQRLLDAGAWGDGVDGGLTIVEGSHTSVVGIWNYEVKKARVAVMVEPFEPLSLAVRAGIEREAARLGVYFKQVVTLVE